MVGANHEKTLLAITCNFEKYFVSSECCILKFDFQNLLFFRKPICKLKIQLITLYDLYETFFILSCVIRLQSYTLTFDEKKF